MRILIPIPFKKDEAAELEGRLKALNSKERPNIEFCGIAAEDRAQDGVWLSERSQTLRNSVVEFQAAAPARRHQSIDKLRRSLAAPQLADMCLLAEPVVRYIRKSHSSSTDGWEPVLATAEAVASYAAKQGAKLSLALEMDTFACLAVAVVQYTNVRRVRQEKPTMTDEGLELDGLIAMDLGLIKEQLAALVQDASASFDKMTFSGGQRVKKEIIKAQAAMNVCSLRAGGGKDKMVEAVLEHNMVILRCLQPRMAKNISDVLGWLRQKGVFSLLSQFSYQGQAALMNNMTAHDVMYGAAQIADLHSVLDDGLKSVLVELAGFHIAVHELLTPGADTPAQKFVRPYILGAARLAGVATDANQGRVVGERIEEKVGKLETRLDTVVDMPKQLAQQGQGGQEVSGAGIGRVLMEMGVAVGGGGGEENNPANRAATGGDGSGGQGLANTECTPGTAAAQALPTPQPAFKGFWNPQAAL